MGFLAGVQGVFDSRFWGVFSVGGGSITFATQGSALFSTQVRLVFDSGALTHGHLFRLDPHSSTLYYIKLSCLIRVTLYSIMLYYMKRVRSTVG